MPPRSFTRSLLGAPWLLLLLAAPVLAAEPLTLERALALALERSPSLAPVEAEAARARAQREGASLLFASNPELEAAVGPRQHGGIQSLELELGVSQRLELFGQRAARIEAAEALMTASEARLRARRVELAAEVRESFGRALAAERAVGLAESATTLAEEALRAAEQRMEAGAASRIEVNSARGELGRARRERAATVQRRAVALGELRLLIGPSVDEELTLAGELEARPRPVPEVDALLARALAQRAELQAARAELEMARAESRLATREALPGPRLGVSYGREEGAQIIQGTLGLELPFFQRNQAARGESAARVTQAERALQAQEQAVRWEVRLALERYRAAVVAAEAYGDGVLAALEENLTLVNEAYRAGKMDFFELLVIRREALDARRDYLEALEELNAAGARLERATGNIP
jgi:cobalt-zinc-cadmium efflux system outer membrane protein